MDTYKDILLFSGGPDSLIAWYYLNQPKCLYVALDHKYERRERQAILDLREKVDIPIIFDGTISLGGWEHEDGHIPLRNSYLIHVAAQYAEERVYLIVQKGEMQVPDRTHLFFERINELFQVLNPELEILTPFFDMTKAEMVDWYLNQGYSKDLLLMTTSCYNGSKRHCGECAACFRRWVAFELNGIEDDFITSPWETELAERYKNKAQSGKYHPQRAGEIIQALERRR